MPYTVGYSFAIFLENITISGDQRSVAETRRNAIVRMLEDGFEIIEAFPIGSLARGTALKGHADVDVLVALHWAKHVKDRSPADVVDAVREHLSDYRAQLVKKNGQAVTLYFETWPHVDIVPGHQVVDSDQDVIQYMIPNLNHGTWIGTRPRTHARKMRKAFGRAPALPRLIRMLKEWNRAHSSYMQSFHIEVIARKLDPSDDDWSWAVLSAFKQLARSAREPIFYPKSSSNQVDAYLTSSDRAELVRRLDTAEERARDAWYATHKGRNDHKTAIEEYRRIFGDRFPAYGS